MNYFLDFYDLYVQRSKSIQIWGAPCVASQTNQVFFALNSSFGALEQHPEVLLSFPNWFLRRIDAARTHDRRLLIYYGRVKL